eukprot:4770523-Pyramimonas_sp.AAC.3
MTQLLVKRAPVGKRLTLKNVPQANIFKIGPISGTSEDTWVGWELVVVARRQVASPRVDS